MSSSDDNSSEDEFMKHEELTDEEQESNEDMDEDEEERESDDEKTEIRSELKDMPFEDLLKLKNKLGTKDYNEALFGKSAKTKTNKPKIDRPADLSDDDEPPLERSAKRQVPALGIVKKKSRVEQPKFRDPRFDSSSGYFSGRQFRSQYSFVNDLRVGEVAELKTQMRQTTDPEEIEKLKYLIQRGQNQDREYKKLVKKDNKRLIEKQEFRQAQVEEGKNPYYVKKSTKKAEDLVSKYMELKESGTLPKHIDKRRKKVTAKDRKKLDFST